MNTKFANIIKKIISQQGEAILANPAALKKFIHNEAAGVSSDLRLAFGRCIEAGAYNELKTAPDAQRRALVKKLLARKVNANTGISIALCNDVVDIIEYVMYGAVPAQSTQTAGVSSPKKQFTLPMRFPHLSVKKYIALSAAAAAVLGIIFFAAFNSGVSVFEPIIEFNGEEYPSKIIAVAATDSMLGGGSRMLEKEDYIGDALGDLGVKLRFSLSGKIARVEIEGDRFIKKSSLETQITSKKSVEVFPRINYNYAELEKLKELYVETVTFKLYVNDKLKKEAVKKIPFHSVEDEPVWDASRNGNKILSNYHFVVVVREMERLEQELEKQNEIQRREAERREAAKREAARREAEKARAAKNPYNDKRVRATLAKVHENIRDVNGDGQVNCIDYSNLFYYYSPFKYNDVVVNYNPRGPGGGMNHQFNVVRIDGQLVFIEPQRNANQAYDMREVWGSLYNPAYNQIHQTDWLYLPRGQSGTEE